MSCKFCNIGNMPSNVTRHDFMIYEDYTGEEVYREPINYCPVCGEPLSDAAKEKERITLDYVIQKKMTRADILDAAKQCVCTDRDQQYGSPENNFKTIADMWSAYFTAKLGHKVEIEPHDVAAAMSLLKIARISNGKPKADSWVDLAGYAACGGELQENGV